MLDVSMSLQLKRRKVTRVRGAQNASKYGFYSGTLSPAEAFDFWPIALKQPPHKGILTKRIERIMAIAFLFSPREGLRHSGPRATLVQNRFSVG